MYIMFIMPTYTPLLIAYIDAIKSLQAFTENISFLHYRYILLSYYCKRHVTCERECGATNCYFIFKPRFFLQKYWF